MEPDGKTSLQASLHEHISALDAISNLLTASIFDLDILLGEIVRITAQLLGVKACTIRLLNNNTGEMELKAVFGLSQHYLAKGPVIAAKSAFRNVIESGEVSEILDISQDPRLQYSAEAIAEGICSRLTVGLLRDGKAIGALSIYTDHLHRFTEDEVQTFQAIANQAAVAVHLARLYQERLEIKRIEQELAIARDIQVNLMPAATPDVDGLQIAAFSSPCESVGGDFYDFIDLPNDNVGIAIGDASGKGIPAALLMATVRTALRVQAENIYAMSDVIRRVNWALCRDTQQEQFATLFYSVFNARDRVLTYVNAGHNYPLLLRGDKVVALKTGGLPVGLFPDLTYQEDTVEIVPGDLLVLYTDGFTEAPNTAGEQFGEERLIRSVCENRHLSCSEIIKNVVNAVSAFRSASGDYCDDHTLVIVKAAG